MALSDGSGGSSCADLEKKKAGDSGGDEAASAQDEYFDLDLPLAARRLSVPLPGTLQGVSSLVENQAWIFPVVLSWTCLGLVAGGIGGSLLGAATGCFFSFCIHTVGSYRRARRIRMGYEARVSGEIRRETQCLFCDDDFTFGRHSGERGDRIYPRGCGGCGKSVCLHCAKLQDETESEGALPPLVKFCPRCQDADSRWDLD